MTNQKAIKWRYLIKKIIKDFGESIVMWLVDFSYFKF